MGRFCFEALILSIIVGISGSSSRGSSFNCDFDEKFCPQIEYAHGWYWTGPTHGVHGGHLNLNGPGPSLSIISSTQLTIDTASCFKFSYRLRATSNSSLNLTCQIPNGHSDLCFMASNVVASDWTMASVNFAKESKCSLVFAASIDGSASSDWIFSLDDFALTPGHCSDHNPSPNQIYRSGLDRLSDKDDIRGPIHTGTVTRKTIYSSSPFTGRSDHVCFSFTYFYTATEGDKYSAFTLELIEIGGERSNLIEIIPLAHAQRLAWNFFGRTFKTVRGRTYQILIKVIGDSVVLLESQSIDYKGCTKESIKSPIDLEHVTSTTKDLPSTYDVLEPLTLTTSIDAPTPLSTESRFTVTTFIDTRATDSEAQLTTSDNQSTEPDQISIGTTIPSMKSTQSVYSTTKQTSTSSPKTEFMASTTELIQTIATTISSSDPEPLNISSAVSEDSDTGVKLSDLGRTVDSIFKFIFGNRPLITSSCALVGFVILMISLLIISTYRRNEPQSRAREFVVSATPEGMELTTIHFRRRTITFTEDNTMRSGSVSSDSGKPKMETIVEVDME